MLIGGSRREIGHEQIETPPQRDDEEEEEDRRSTLASYNRPVNRSPYRTDVPTSTTTAPQPPHYRSVQDETLSVPSTAHLFEGTINSSRPLTFRKQSDQKSGTQGLRRSELSSAGMLSRSSSQRRVSI